MENTAVPDWIGEIKILKQKVSELDNQDDLIVFYGSSSIRLWENINEDFSAFNVLNLGFGGSTYGWCNYYFLELFEGLSPSEIILYGGDNDLSNSSVEKAISHLNKLLDKISNKYPQTKISIISVKPSPERNYLESQILNFNSKLRNITNSIRNGQFINIHSLMLDKDGFARKDLFTEDQLHMNEKGYEIWKNAISNHLKSQRI